MRLRWSLVLLCLAGWKQTAHSQIIYGNMYNENTGEEFFIKINLSTCEFCFLAPANPNVGGTDVVILPDGSQLHIEGLTTNGLKRLSAPPALNLLWQTSTTPIIWYGGERAPNGLVYLAGAQGFGTFNPANNTVTYIGDWPASFNTVVDIYFVNGVLYGTGYDVNGLVVFVQINVIDPSLSVIVGPLFTTYAAEGGTWNGNAGFFYTDDVFDVYFHNPQDGTSTLICDMPLGLNVYGLSFPPPGLPEYDCIVTCTTDAGVLTGGPYNTCTNATLNFPPATQFNLDANDLLQYILFTNPSDTAGSIVATSATPSFSFDPPLQTGVTYYIAAMAGNNAGGNVDLTDPCLDFSNALQVVWRPLPAVTFSVNNANLCAGECRNVTANFTGTPPFSLTYTTPSGTFTQTFNSNSGVIQVCAPQGAPPGPLQVQATALTDAWCTCQ